MMTDIRITADEAKRLKNDTAFQQFVNIVRENKRMSLRLVLPTKWSSEKMRTQ